ncbi:MAG: gamma-glutamyltransferase family protein [Hyphomonadaceae bacterium]|nr:gamma-glutamyltransferase family protein [Hyphomonadaceae bacterium]
MFDKRSLCRLGAALAALALTACATATAPTPSPPRGEAMAAAANPHAVEAALEILREGGSAVDAAIAAEAVLGLVEPQSSGIGGGGFLLSYDAETERIVGYDGRERAPAGASPTLFLDARGRPMSFLDAQASGLSIGAPSLIAMLKLAHDDHGRLPWARLFEPAIRLAENGFAVSPRLARLIALAGERGRLRADFVTRAYFFNRDGTPLQVGQMLRNPEYAATLRAIAEQGPAALQQGPIADAIVAAAQRGPRGGTLTHADLRAVSPRRLEPVCGTFRVYRVCTTPAPSSGNAVLAVLGLYERARPHPEGATNIDDWAAFLWSSRLAYADRDHYMADDQFVPVPTQELVAPGYLDERARQIDLARAPLATPPGMPAGPELFERWGRDVGDDAGTTHLSIVDAWGDAAALTATVESAFGSQRMAAGFLLNNQLTDFSFQPARNGRPVANAVAPGKAPRSSMSPTIVTDRDGELVLVIGSPGGSAIIGYVARATIGILDWNLPVQDALAIGNATAREAPARVESQSIPAGVVDGLRARGWDIQDSAAEVSGLHAIRVRAEGLEGGADPRREGVVGHVPAPAPAIAPPR